MRRFLVSLLVAASALMVGAAVEFVDPPALSRVNAALKADWLRQGLSPVARVSDEVFIRRVYLDVAGRAPRPAEVVAFLKNTDSAKRAKLIDHLLASAAGADVMAMRYADMFRIKSEFPINLWPNAVQLFSRYLRDTAVNDRPWNETARRLLTSSGSNFREPGVNFYRAFADRTPEGLARAVALTFLNVRLEKLPENTRSSFSAFFSRIRFKSTAEWKEEVLFIAPEPAVVEAAALDGTSYTVNSPDTDPRTVMADWLLNDPELIFSKAMVNRVWYWIFGRGIVNPADDMAAPANRKWWNLSGLFPLSSDTAAPVNPELLEVLAGEFKASGYSVRFLQRLILNSDAYMADWKTVPAEMELATAHFAVYPVRRLEAELIVDLIGDLSGRRESYRSVIPEPFTVMPPTTRSVQLTDGSISSTLLDSFGRSPRDSGLLSERNNVINGSQRLFMMNSANIYRGLQDVYKQRFRRLKRWQLRTMIEQCYLIVLSRKPTATEIKTVTDYAAAAGERDVMRRTAVDLLWVLVNSKEFMYHH